MNFDWVPNTLEDLACYWLKYYGEAYKSPSSYVRDLGMLRLQILPYLGDRPPSDLTTLEIERWFLYLRQNSRLSDKTCNDVLGLLRKIFNDGLRWGFIKENPVIRVRKLPVAEQSYQYWRLEEVNKFLSFFQAWPTKPKGYWYIHVALFTGMRRGELVALKWPAIDLSAGIITVRESFCATLKVDKPETKSKKIRYVPIPETLKETLYDLRCIESETPYVLPRICADTLNRQVQKLATRAATPVIRFHDLRHSYASQFIQAGGSLYDLQKILGHSTVQVTERYSHLDPRTLRGKADILGFSPHVKPTPFHG